MDADEKVLDNSLESTMNMSQDDIEKLLLQYEQQGTVDETTIDDPDLASLLEGLETQDDAIQDISELLNKSDRNQAVDDEVMALLNSQEEEGLTAYDAMDLFSEEGVAKKEGFIAKLLGKFIKKPNHKEDKDKKKEKASKEKKIKKESKKDKKKHQREEIQDWEKIELQDEEEISVQSDSMNDALTLLTGDADDRADGLPEKHEKEKKVKKKSRKEDRETEEADIKEKTKKSKGKKKGKKEKKKDNKEKKSKNEKNEIREKVKEKPTIADAIMELEAEQEEPPHKNKVIMTFVASILIMLGFLVVNFYFTGHANKRQAEEAYEEQDYLECYQLLYGQKMNDSQRAMYKRSECILKTEIFWRDYHVYVESEKWLEGLDELTQYVYQYPKHLEEAKTWNGQDLLTNTYLQVQEVLVEEYDTSAEEVMKIAELRSDEDYTRALMTIAEEKEKREALNKKYPDMLPEEKDRLSQ